MQGITALIGTAAASKLNVVNGMGTLNPNPFMLCVVQGAHKQWNRWQTGSPLHSPQSC